MEKMIGGDVRQRLSQGGGASTMLENVVFGFFFLSSFNKLLGLKASPVTSALFTNHTPVSVSSTLRMKTVITPLTFNRCSAPTVMGFYVTEISPRTFAKQTRALTFKSRGQVPLSDFIKFLFGIFHVETELVICFF